MDQSAGMGMGEGIGNGGSDRRPLGRRQGSIAGQALPERFAGKVLEGQGGLAFAEVCFEQPDHPWVAQAPDRSRLRLEARKCRRLIGQVRV